MKSITKETGYLMMDCAMVALGRLVGAEELIKHQTFYEDLARNAFCDLRESKGIDKVIEVRKGFIC